MPSHLLKWCLIACKYTRSDQKVARLNWYFIYFALCRNTFPRNKYRHVIAHSSNMGSFKLQQWAVLEVIVDILEVPTTSVSLFLKDGGNMSIQNFDNHLWNCSFPYPEEHNLNLWCCEDLTSMLMVHTIAWVVCGQCKLFLLHLNLMIFKIREQNLWMKLQKKFRKIDLKISVGADTAFGGVAMDEVWVVEWLCHIKDEWISIYLWAASVNDKSVSLMLDLMWSDRRFLMKWPEARISYYLCLVVWTKNLRVRWFSSTNVILW